MEWMHCVPLVLRMLPCTSSAVSDCALLELQYGSSSRRQEDAVEMLQKFMEALLVYFGEEVRGRLAMEPFRLR